MKGNIMVLLRYMLFVCFFIAFADFFAYIQFRHILNVPMHPVNFVIPSLLGVIFGTLLFFSFHFFLKAKEREIYESIAKTDFLTGALSRYAFESIYQNEYKRFERTHRPFSLLMFDIDNFKKVNDRYGHHTGDRILKELCHVIRKELRSIDLLCRWGGEEFLVILPETKKKEIDVIAERLRHSVAEHDFGLERLITISLGGIEINDTEAWGSDTFLNKVDEALYQSKREGKNRTVICCDEPQTPA